MFDWEVVYLDEETGDVGSVYVKAGSVLEACEKVEMMGEYEVISCECVS